MLADLYEIPDPDDRIDRALRAVNLADRVHDACGSLSKGLRQRVALARALLSDPEVLFLDEPTAGLPAVDGWRQDGPATYVLNVSEPAVAAPAVTRALVAAGAEVLSINQPRHSLEEVHLELVDRDQEAGQG